MLLYDMVFALSVPNVPCGVESKLCQKSRIVTFSVPNVPCGVESGHAVLVYFDNNVFLMYRVELKDNQLVCVFNLHKRS